MLTKDETLLCDALSTLSIAIAKGFQAENDMLVVKKTAIGLRNPAYFNILVLTRKGQHKLIELRLRGRLPPILLVHADGLTSADWLASFAGLVKCAETIIAEDAAADTWHAKRKAEAVSNILAAIHTARVKE